MPVDVAFDPINKLASENADNFPGKDPVTGKYYTARELQARYLYVLAYLLCDMDYLQTVCDDGSGNGNKLACRYLAQWAVNVVDFRDRDSIMTRFTFDTNLKRRLEPAERRQLCGLGLRAARVAADRSEGFARPADEGH